MKSLKGIWSVLAGLALILGIFSFVPVYAESEEGDSSEVGSSEEAESGESGAGENGSNDDSNGGNSNEGNLDESEHDGGQGSEQGDEYNGAIEWSGVIVDPVSDSTSTPVTSNTVHNTTPIYTSASVSGAGYTYVSARAATIEPEINEQGEVVETEPILVEEMIEVVTEEVQEKSEEDLEDDIEIIVPKTIDPETLESVKRTTIIIIIAIGAVSFIGVLIWGMMRFLKDRRFKKIYREAVSKSAEIKRAKITRAG